MCGEKYLLLLCAIAALGPYEDRTLVSRQKRDPLLLRIWVLMKIAHYCLDRKETRSISNIPLVRV